MSDTFSARGNAWYIDKDPNAVLDYTTDWTNYLAPISDTIASAVVVLDGSSGLTQPTSATVTSTSVTLWLGGGTAGLTGSVTVRITTTGGRIDDRTFFVNIVER
jgi:hypothetical protein